MLSDPSWPGGETVKVEQQVMVDIDLKLESSWMLQATNACTMTGRTEGWIGSLQDGCKVRCKCCKLKHF